MVQWFIFDEVKWISQMVLSKKIIFSKNLKELTSNI